MTINDIKKYIDDYVIQNGNVYLKSNNQQVMDEEIILKVKSARLIYNEAREKYQSDARQFGKPNGDFPKYVTKMMEQLSVNGEVNSYGTNKLINSLLSSNGHFEEFISGNDLVNSKFSMLVGVKQDYGLAYLKLKFREKGLDIDNLNIKQDLSELKHNGVSRVIIDFQVKKYEKKDTSTIQHQDGYKFFSHPKADLLNELEKQKKEALAQNDQVAYNFSQSNIERIVRENPVEVSAEQWASMGYEERKSFIMIKMKESKVLNDEVNFNFWNSNLRQLEEKKQEILNRNNQITENDKNSLSQLQQIKEQPVRSNNDSRQMIDTTNSLYEKMVNALNKSRIGNLTETEKKQIVGEIYYYEGFLVESIKDEKTVGEIMAKAIQDFSNTQFEQSIFNSLVSELQERLKIIAPKNIEEEKFKNSNFSSNISVLKQEMSKLSIEYKEMLSDGMIDDQELEYLIEKMQILHDDAMSLKGNNLSHKEYQIVNDIISSILKEQSKMTTLKNGIEQSVQGFSR